MGNYGIKIAKPGKNITSTFLGDYIFHSSYPVLKIALKQIGTLNIATGKTDTATIAHNLGYKPMFSVVAEDSPGNYYELSYSSYCGLGVSELLLAYVDTTNLYIQYNSPCNYAVGSNVNYLAFIYYDPLQ